MGENWEKEFGEGCELHPAAFSRGHGPANRVQSFLTS